MSSDEVARTLRTTSVKPFPRSGMHTPRVGSPHGRPEDAASYTRAKCATSWSGTSFELTLPASWKKVSR